MCDLVINFEKIGNFSNNHCSFLICKSFLHFHLGKQLQRHVKVSIIVTSVSKCDKEGYFTCHFFVIMIRHT